MRLTVEGGNDKDLVQLIKQNGLITDPVNDDGSTLLHIAAIKGHLRKRLCYYHCSCYLFTVRGCNMLCIMNCQLANNKINFICLNEILLNRFILTIESRAGVI